MEKKIWKPISEAQIKLEEIIHCLENEPTTKSFSLMGNGSMGTAILFYYYWKYTQNERYLEKADSIILENIKMSIPSGPNAHSLCNGTAGFRWAISHLTENGFIDGDAEELFADDDSILHAAMVEDIKGGHYDYLHNAIGIGLYFLKRKNDQAAAYVASLVDGLDRTAINDQHGFKWLSLFNLQETNGKKAVYNFSLSHGMASIIFFLAKAYQAGIAQDQAKKLLDGAISYILSHQLAPSDSRTASLFPSVVLAENDQPILNSRLAWCYGDLGLGVALWQVSKMIGNGELENNALEVLLQTATRKNPAKEGVIDAGFCHGSAGIAHIYNRLYQYTGNETFKHASLHWLEDILSKAVFADGVAGYKAWHPPAYGGWKRETALLQGISGIGLVLLAAESDITPDWDACFLLS